MLTWTAFFFFFFPVFIFTKLNYHLFRIWSWRRGEGRDAAEGYLPDKLLGDASYRPKSDFSSSHFERRRDRFYTWDNRPDCKGPDERFKIQYGVIRCRRWRWWGGVKNVWWDDKASPWMLLMGGGLWPSSVPLLLCWWDETTAICFHSYLPPLTPPHTQPVDADALCRPFKRRAGAVFRLLLEVTRFKRTTIKHKRTRGKRTINQLNVAEATFTAAARKIIHKWDVGNLNICALEL